MIDLTNTTPPEVVIPTTRFHVPPPVASEIDQPMILSTEDKNTLSTQGTSIMNPTPEDDPPKDEPPKDEHSPNLPIDNFMTQTINSDGLTLNDKDYEALATLWHVEQLDKGVQNVPLTNNKAVQTDLDMATIDKLLKPTELTTTESHRFTTTTATRDGTIHEVNINLNLN